MDNLEDKIIKFRELAKQKRDIDQQLEQLRIEINTMEDHESMSAK